MALVIMLQRLVLWLWRLKCYVTRKQVYLGIFANLNRKKNCLYIIYIKADYKRGDS